MSPSFIHIAHKDRALKLETRWVNKTADPDRPTLIFLHEGLGTAHAWKTIPEMLCEQLACPGFAYTRAGYGNSDPIPLPRKINYLHTEALEILPRVIQEAQIEKYILIGHSDGGSIALIHAGKPPNPGLVAVITLAAHMFCEAVTVKGLKKIRKHFKDSKVFQEKLERHHGANTHTAFWGWNDVWLSPKFMQWNIEKYLPGIRVPTLGLQGKEDQYATKAQLDSMARGIKDIQVHEIAQCDHAPHLEQKEITCGLMIDFISALIHYP